MTVTLNTYRESIAVNAVTMILKQQGETSHDFIATITSMRSAPQQDYCLLIRKPSFYDSGTQHTIMLMV